ncbi:MAG: glycosyltransferase family 1 protein [Patescibacteria group bacterium]|jgi:glycosyltransferase involved in cell wall biosynthesis
MRIGIDARFFGPIGKGLGRYTEKLIQYLQDKEDGHTYRIYLRRENMDAFTPRSPRFQKVLAPFRWYSLQEQIAFPRLLNRDGLDLMHFPHFNVPLLYRKPFIVTIHDLILTRFPTNRATTLGPLRYFVKRKAYDLVIRSALHRSQKIITVSRYSKDQILDHFPELPSKKIVVTYEGVDDLAASATGVIPAAVQQPYFLYIGNAYPHKNLEKLLEAMKLFSEDDDATKLVLVGKMDYFYTRLVDYARELDISDRIVFTGYVDDATLSALYTHAAAYIIPSLEEGFGLPPLEAMMHKIPVLAAQASCLPEILADGAEYMDPHDIYDMAKHMRRILNDEVLRASLVRNGTTNVLPRYSWNAMVEETRSIYEQA